MHTHVFIAYMCVHCIYVSQSKEACLPFLTENTRLFQFVSARANLKDFHFFLFFAQDIDLLGFETNNRLCLHSSFVVCSVYKYTLHSSIRKIWFYNMLHRSEITTKHRKNCETALTANSRYSKYSRYSRIVRFGWNCEIWPKRICHCHCLCIYRCLFVGRVMFHSDKSLKGQKSQRLLFQGVL